MRRLTLAKLVYRARSSASRATKAAAAGRVEVPEPRLRPANARALQIKVKAPQHSCYNRRRLSLLSLNESYPIVRSRGFAHDRPEKHRPEHVVESWLLLGRDVTRYPGESPACCRRSRGLDSFVRVGVSRPFIGKHRHACASDRARPRTLASTRWKRERRDPVRVLFLPTRAPSQPSLSRPSSASRTRAAKSEFSREANPLGGEERKERETRATGYVH